MNDKISILKGLVDKYTTLANHYADLYMFGPKQDQEKNRQMESKYDRLLIEAVRELVKEVCHEKTNI